MENSIHRPKVVDVECEKRKPRFLEAYLALKIEKLKQNIFSFIDSRLFRPPLQ